MAFSFSDNIIFQKAVSFVNQTNKHLFLTGKAGTGKTTFLQYIRDNCLKNLAIVAPTGVAAIHAGGVTIHSMFWLPFGLYLPTSKSVWNDTEEQSNIYNKHRLLESIKLNKEKKELIKKIDLLIVDEVSMLRADTLDAIDEIMRFVRNKPNVSFGGVQMLFIGDLFQLPPVVKNEDWIQMKEYYKSPFFFDAQVFRQSPPVYLELKKIYRQSDVQFISLLNNLRNNTCSAEDMNTLNQYYNPDFQLNKNEGYITLTSHNAKADKINKDELEKLHTKLHKFEAIIENDFPERMFPAEQTLMLKEGAQIMFIKNDKGESRKFYNGKIGTIHSINHEGKITVKFPESNDIIELQRETWENIKYKLNKDKNRIEEEVIGTFEQFPIRLAWAITIHKSQGLTFDKAIIDAGMSFAPGQVYVALSRLTKIEGLVLLSRIYNSSVTTDERVLDFARNELSETELQQALEFEQLEFIQQYLLQAFDLNDLLQELDTHLQEYENRNIPNKEIFEQQSITLKNILEKEKEIADKFSFQIRQLFSQTGNNNFQHLNNRTKAAVEWFKKDLAENIVQPLQDQIKNASIKQKTKKYVQELEFLRKEVEQKIAQIETSLLLTEGLEKGTSILELHKQIAQLNSKPTDPNKENKTISGKGESKLISLSMFTEGKSIAQIAEERGYAQSTIEGHLATYVLSGELDASKLIAAEKLTAVLSFIQSNTENISATFIKNELGEDYNYFEIRVAINEWRRKNISSN